MEFDTAVEERGREGPFAFVTGAAATLIALLAIALILCYVITGPQRWPGANRPSIPGMVLLVWAPITAVLSPVYALPGYYWARHRGQPRLARGILFMTVTMFVLGAGGVGFLWLWARGMQGLR
jgi:hypothetical protein